MVLAGQAVLTGKRAHYTCGNLHFAIVLLLFRCLSVVETGSQSRCLQA